MKYLVIITGIGKGAYGLKDLKESGAYSIAAKKYHRILEIDYQPLMDNHAIAFKTLGDPLRYMLSPNHKNIIAFIKEELSKLPKHAEIDLLTHSLAGWVLQEVDVKVNVWYDLASAVGWCLPLGRAAISFRVGTPKIQYEKKLWIYSSKDIVSMCPPKNDQRFSRSAYFHDTRTNHDLKEYLMDNIFIKGLSNL